ncbi:ABC transporter permease [Proteocatella sphenisci]|uniref:ABC transporter permease n=1 Tax=Proteocatella sphenisci TaxID=181070 RepID=UPI00048FF279|nr:ABC transporter permease [Proteocatella sphenisci]
MLNLKYVFKKTFQLVITLLILSAVIFVISRLSPGDPLRSYFGDSMERMTPKQLNTARINLGLNDNIIVQYFRWLKNALKGNFGISYKYKQDVVAVIAKVYLNTLYLTVSSFIVIFTLAFLLAIICVINEGTILDRFINKMGIASSSIPVFFVALMLIMFFSVNTGILPSSGAYSYMGSEGFSDRLRHLILPVSSVVITHLWYCTHLIKSKLSDEIRKEYVLLCKVKGLSQIRIIFFHCMKNIMPAVVSVMAVFLPHLIGGSYVVEMVFSYPGLGMLGFESALYQDYNMLMVICLITGFTVVSASMIAQVINEKMDPRMKHDKIDGGKHFE